MGDGITWGRSPESEDFDTVLVAVEAAKFLKLSPRTLEKWRSEGLGPPVLRMGRRVAYARRDLVRWLAEQEARGRKESSVKNLEVTSRPYFKDRTRQHVDINLTHPLDPARAIRRRIVAPVGMDAVADHTAVPRVTYTDPEVASVGLTEAAARANGLDVIVVTRDPAETARGYIHNFQGGALKLVADRRQRELVGATLVTPRAGEIIGELVLAVKLRTPLATLADVIHPFPAFNRVLGEALSELAHAVRQ